ncbi:MAG: LysR family transcriptional regulator [Acuticoccus sp.]
MRLFDRALTRGSALTDAGRVFLEGAERVEAEMLGVAARLNEREATLAGTVRIGAPDGLGSAYLASRLGAIAELYPLLRVQLVPLPRNFSLSEREADIAVMIGRPAKGRLIARHLADYSLGFYAAPSYLAAHGEPANVDALGDHRLVGYVEDLVYTPELNYAEELVRDWRPRFEVSTAIGQREVVRAGTAIGLLHDFMAADDPRLVPILTEHSALRAYYAVWHENLRSSRKISAVVALLGDVMQADRHLFVRQHRT